MNTKYIIGAVVVLIVLVFGFTWGNKKVIAPEAPVNNIEQVLIPTVPVTQVVSVSKPITSVIKPVTTATQSLPTMTKGGAYIVSYTNDGFVPKNLTIKVGKSVHFVNNSSKAMSITTTTTQNQIQSEFNQGKTVGQGGSYDFTFLATGSWVYMNRNAKTDFATIIVE